MPLLRTGVGTHRVRRSGSGVIVVGGVGRRRCTWLWSDLFSVDDCEFLLHNLYSFDDIGFRRSRSDNGFLCRSRSDNGFLGRSRLDNGFPPPSPLPLLTCSDPHLLPRMPTFAALYPPPDVVMELSTILPKPNIRVPALLQTNLPQPLMRHQFRIAYFVHILQLISNAVREMIMF